MLHFPPTVPTLFPRTDVCSCVGLKKYCHFAQLLLQAIVHAQAFMPHWLVLCWFLVNWRKRRDNTQKIVCAFTYKSSILAIISATWPSFRVMLQPLKADWMYYLLMKGCRQCRLSEVRRHFNRNWGSNERGDKKSIWSEQENCFQNPLNQDFS